MTTDNRSDRIHIVRSRWHQWWTKAGAVKAAGFMTQPAEVESAADDDAESLEPRRDPLDAERRDSREPVRAGGAQNCTFEVF